ncbi:hypothetical protein [Mesorhizobium sp. Pch-S]|uniref:A1S_2505 family phage non-structural protein n=1 Tax=Mesorhizobium sp. Pch-S TaxID=2082387 RepID=UPI001011175F|nr:hypothetical protein [Mesorhizobium sp. Pch-S]QAZ45902.1 hypothetical protein C1M53_26305 [Mesorhizobium sp. Pch-S]
MSDPVFVFGSNLAGRHGKGAALWAKQHRGAIYGQGEGYQGNSYAIPTKDERIQTLPLFRIRNYAHRFKRFAREHSELTFQLTPIGCGLAGYTPEQIAPMFDDAPANVNLPDEFMAALGRALPSGEQP